MVQYEWNRSFAKVEDWIQYFIEQTPIMKIIFSKM